QLNEPPTYIKLVWDEDEAISFYPEQRRYLRIETDAHSGYHDANNPVRSRINLILTGQDLRLVGTTPLQSGRMRAILEATASANKGANGNVRVELTRQGLPTLLDARNYTIRARPPTQPATRRV